MSDLGIERAGAGDARAVAELIGLAFHDLRVARWLVPDPAARGRVLPANFGIFVDHAVAHGEIDVTADGAGVAVWFPRRAEPPPAPEDYEERLLAACGTWTERFHILDKLFDAHHPHRAHDHLAFLAVHPDRQRAGIGTRLLRHRHAELDRHGIPAYLEASSAESRRLYERHGYTAADPFTLPDGTPMWPMWRPPGVP